MVNFTKLQRTIDSKPEPVSSLVKFYNFPKCIQIDVFSSAGMPHDRYLDYSSKMATDTGACTEFTVSTGGSRLRSPPSFAARSRQAPDNPISETFSFDWRLANATGDISSRFQQQGRSGISLSWK